MKEKETHIVDCGTCCHVLESETEEKKGHGKEAHGHEGHSHGGGDSGKKQVIEIALALALFIVGLFYRAQLHDTPFSFGEYLAFGTSFLIAGWNVLSVAGRNILRGRIFDENFLMSIATLGAIAIHQLPEAVGVMLFFKVGEFFQDLAVGRSRRSIKSLLEIRPDHANVLSNGEIKQAKPQDVEVGTEIVVKPGEKVPLDGEVLEGSSQVDTSALTGEPVPRMAEKGSTVLAGMINKTGSLTVKVTKAFSDSSLSKILDLVENASGRKAPTEKFITTFARYYTPAVVFGALAVALLPPLLMEGAAFHTWIYRALILLVISCPCALVISIPLGYFGGVGGASRRGILVKGANFLDALTQVTTVVFDKTGTLTKGVFKVVEFVPHNGFGRDELLEWAALAESRSDHPIAKSVLEAYGKTPDQNGVSDYEEVAGHGIRARIRGRQVLAGNDRLMHREKIPHDSCDAEGTVVHVAVDMKYAGYLVIADELKEDAGEAIRRLKEAGIRRTLMFTGDNEAAARSIAGKLGLDSYRAELLPEEKVSSLERLLDEGDGKVAFVGDGINDAPVLMRADVGIAMGELGSDAAIDTADVVLMTDAPSKVAEAVHAARKTRGIVWQNIALALSVKGVFIVLGVFGLATMWEAVFADVGVALLAIFNATRALSRGAFPAKEMRPSLLLQS